MAILAVAAVACASVATASTPTKAEQLRAYLASMKPVVKAIQREENRVVIGDTASGPLASVGRNLLRLSAKAKVIVSPTVLRGPHADLVRGVRVESTAFANYNGVDERFLTTLIRGRRLQNSWREEVIFQLRRAGLAVPLWLKTFGGRGL